MPEYFFAPKKAQGGSFMAIFTAKTNLVSKDGFQFSYEINFDMNCHGKIRSATLISPNIRGIRSYMFLDLLANLMPKWLYTGNTFVSFGHTHVDHPVIGKLSQPCLIVEDDKYGKTNYLINRNSDEKWLETVYSQNLAAMVIWWRENRDEYFKKPRQKWEIEKHS